MLVVIFIFGAMPRHNEHSTIIDYDQLANELVIDLLSSRFGFAFSKETKVLPSQLHQILTCSHLGCVIV